jgi:hypothetical protein
MAFTFTTLSGDVATGDLNATVASTAGFPKGSLMNIDSEFMPLTATTLAGANVLQIRRGDQGGYPAAHVSGAVAIIGLPSDFPPAPPGAATLQPVAPNWAVQTVVASGAIAVPATRQNVFVQLLGSTTNAYTLADPTYAQIGQELLIQAVAAHAYTVTLPNTDDLGFNNGDTDVATFGGAIGDNIHLKAVAYSGGAKWNVIDSVNVSLSDT